MVVFMAGKMPERLPEGKKFWSDKFTKASGQLKSHKGNVFEHYNNLSSAMKFDMSLTDRPGIDATDAVTSHASKMVVDANNFSSAAREFKKIVKEGKARGQISKEEYDAHMKTLNELKESVSSALDHAANDVRAHSQMKWAKLGMSGVEAEGRGIPELNESADELVDAKSEFLEPESGGILRRFKRLVGAKT